MASSDLGELGPGKGEPAIVEWHWYYHLPSFAGWALIAALLVLVKENRNRQAWLILIPFFLLSEVLSTWAGYFFQEVFAYQWLVVGWTAVWLLSPWLARRRPVYALALALELAAIIGIAAQFYICIFCIYQRGVGIMHFFDYAISIFALLFAFTLSGLCCRRTYRPWRFLVWLIPWLILGVGLGFTCEFVWLFSREWSPWPFSFILRTFIVPSTLQLAPVLYLLNLPFMILAFRCPAYRDRFHKILRLPQHTPGATILLEAVAERAAGV